MRLEHMLHLLRAQQHGVGGGGGQIEQGRPGKGRPFTALNSYFYFYF